MCIRDSITEALWGSKVSPATISELNKKAYVHIEDWRNRPLQGGRYPYVYVDGIYPVSYTHLDVYKRQELGSSLFPWSLLWAKGMPRWDTA